MSNPYVEAIFTLDKAFDYFNDKLCNNTLDRPIINILSRGARKCLGWHWQDKWQCDGEYATEITIVGESLNRPIEEVLETLLHEMAHLYNSQAGVKDCNAQQRHNKHFKKTAESVFHLQVDRHPTRGWALTSLTETSRALIGAFLQESKVHSINLVRVPTGGVGGVKKKTYMISVTEEDHALIKDMANNQDMSQKEVISFLINKFSEELQNEEKIA